MFNRNRMKLEVTIHNPWALSTLKCVCGQAPAANAFLVYLEPREHVRQVKRGKGKERRPRKESDGSKVSLK